MERQNRYLNVIISYMLFGISLLCAFMFKEYEYNQKIFLGFLILIISLHLLWKFRKDRFFILMFGIIFYINITICFSDCITNGNLTVPLNSLAWQTLRQTKYETDFLIALCLFLSTVNLFFKKDQCYIENRVLLNKSNIYCFIFGLSILIYGLLNSYTSSVSSQDGYVSDTSTIYEYCILFFLLTWYYAGKSKYRNLILIVYALLYIITAVLHGDRSSAFPMVLLLVLLYLPRMSLKKVFGLSCLGILAANTISVYRNNYSLVNFWATFINDYGFKSICSDTVSFSYYTGISIAYVKEYIGNSMIYFIDFFIGIFLGGSFGNADIISFCRQFSMNRGGGMCVANFYFYFGFIGTIVLGLIVGLMCKYIQKRNTNLSFVIKIYIVVDVFRWYLYSSFDLFRGVLFVLPVTYLIFYIIDKVTKKEATTVQDITKERILKA